MVRTIGFGITELAEEKSQFATYCCVTMDKWLNSSKLELSVSQSCIVQIKAEILSFMFTPVYPVPKSRV